MNSIFQIIVAFVSGIVLGVVYFGGLFYTVQKKLHSRNVAVWFMLSFFFRAGVAVAGFYFVCRESWQLFLGCLAGFIVARFLVILLTKKAFHEDQS